MRPDPDVPWSATHEGHLPVNNAQLYYRDVGSGRHIVVLHGGADFDHNYLLPDMDRLSDAFHLIYYDQRGRGRSAVNVQPGEVSLASEIADLDALREHFKLPSIGLLGHSWGGLLAMEYAIRYPGRVSHLILMNSGPASSDDYAVFRNARRTAALDDVALLAALSSTPEYARGDLEADAAYYRVHFRSALKDPGLLERLIERLRANVTPAGILMARAIESRLLSETWLAKGYDLLPRLHHLRVPTLIIHGDHDLVPMECVAHIADAIPGARLVVLRDCGHFAYLECPDQVRREISAFFHSA
jgi:proline iminopeptidase